MMHISFDPFPCLTTKRLTLRRVEVSDVNEVFFLRSDQSVMQYIDRAPAQSADEALQWIKHIHELERSSDAVTWAISLKENLKLIGTICFWNIAKEHYRAEIGYVLHPYHQGKGLMQEAFEVVLDYGFRTLKLHSVEANVNPGNQASIKLLERNGFIREAYFRENYYYDGKFLDTAIYSLLTTIKEEVL
ncbi:MAG: GNAT family N-acetyltransferase [Flavisolibacter sp.]|nr:GNAT family N-acetyltransferase [Flavisolibacter sp.]